MVMEKSPQMILLDNYIKKSGLRIGYICKRLGISRQGFNYKRRGRSPFKASEVYVLVDLLKISDEDMAYIFLP